MKFLVTMGNFILTKYKISPAIQLNSFFTGYLFPQLSFKERLARMNDIVIY